MDKENIAQNYTNFAKRDKMLDILNVIYLFIYILFIHIF